jgi:hypothetical protein
MQLVLFGEAALDPKGKDTRKGKRLLKNDTLWPVIGEIFVANRSQYVTASLNRFEAVRSVWLV